MCGIVGLVSSSPVNQALYEQGEGSSSRGLPHPGHAQIASFTGDYVTGTVTAEYLAWVEATVAS